MNNPITICSEILTLIGRDNIEKSTMQFESDKNTKHFTTKIQLTVMISAIAKRWNSLREIETGLITISNNLYHLGIEKQPKRTTLAYANNNRDSKVFETICRSAINNVSNQMNISKRAKLKTKIIAIDSTVITVSLNLFKWAKYSHQKGAIKLHFGVDAEYQIPEFLNITDGVKHDVVGANFDAKKFRGSVVCFDRGYFKYEYLRNWNREDITFVTRIRKDIQYEVIGQHGKPVGKGVLKDEVIQFSKSKIYGESLRLVTYISEDTGKIFQFLTNNFNYTAEAVANIYRSRWEIEVFFRWIKQNLKIKSFYGTSENAVRTQIWISLLYYVILQYIKLKSRYPYGILELTRVLREVFLRNITIIDILDYKFRSVEKYYHENLDQINLFAIS